MIKKSVIHLCETLLEARIKTKKNTLHIKIHSVPVAKTVWDRIKAEKNDDKDGKALYKLMSNAVCATPIGNLRYRINV